MKGESCAGIHGVHAFAHPGLGRASHLWQGRAEFLCRVPVKFLARFGPCEVVEGGGVEGVAILEFPTMADAKAWYNGAVYQEARKHRFLGGDYSVIFVEGSEPAKAR